MASARKKSGKGPSHVTKAKQRIRSDRYDLKRKTDEIKDLVATQTIKAIRERGDTRLERAHANGYVSGALPGFTDAETDAIARGITHGYYLRDSFTRDDVIKAIRGGLVFGARIGALLPPVKEES